MGHQGNNTIMKTFKVNRYVLVEKTEVVCASYSKSSPVKETSGLRGFTRLAELERQLAELRKERANPERVTLKELRKETPVLEEIERARTDLMSEGEITARAEVDRLSQLLADAIADNGEVVENGNNNGANQRAAP